MIYAQQMDAWLNVSEAGAVFSQQKAVQINDD